MPSNTQITNKRRRRKLSSNARKKTKARTRAGTPAFPIHLETETASNPASGK